MPEWKIAATYQKEADGRQHPPDCCYGDVLVHDNGYGTVQVTKDDKLVAAFSYQTRSQQSNFFEARDAMSAAKLAVEMLSAAGYFNT